MPEAGSVDGHAAQASARSGCGDEEPGANLGFEYLPCRAEYYSRMPRPGTRHGADYYSHVLRGRGERDTGAAAGSDDLRADADRIPAGKIWADQAPASDRGRVPGQVRSTLEGLSISRVRFSNLR